MRGAPGVVPVRHSCTVKLHHTVCREDEKIGGQSLGPVAGGSEYRRIAQNTAADQRQIVDRRANHDSLSPTDREWCLLRQRNLHPKIAHACGGIAPSATCPATIVTSKLRFKPGRAVTKNAPEAGNPRQATCSGPRRDPRSDPIGKQAYFSRRFARPTRPLSRAMTPARLRLPATTPALWARLRLLSRRNRATVF